MYQSTTYYDDVQTWINSTTKTADTSPTEPTIVELDAEFEDFDNVKAMSDTIIWNSGKFIPLFGPTANHDPINAPMFLYLVEIFGNRMGVVLMMLMLWPVALYLMIFQERKQKP